MGEDLDNLIDWKGFYGRFFKEMKPAGENKMLVKCPFHHDEHASMWYNTKNGLWKCEACGESGNAQSFLEKKEGISGKEAYKQLRKIAGLEDTPQRKKPVKYTIEEYCKEKHFPTQFIEALGIKNGKVGISIPYMDESGEAIAHRQRYNPQSAMRFSWNRGSKTNLYGLWKMPQFRKDGYVVLVEGESDAQTLWLYNIPALGVPGASTFRADWAEAFSGMRVYIHQEPDLGGETFMKKVCKGLAAKKFSGDVYVIQIPEMKDPSELHIKDEGHFLERWGAVIETARPIDIQKYITKVEEVIPGAPIQLRIPAGWAINKSGIFCINEKTGLPSRVCGTPILLTNRIKSLDTGEEKIEIAFYRDAAWQKEIMQRSTLFQTRTITQLADTGITVTSENSKPLVKYLGEMEAENMDILPLRKSVSQLGWYGRYFIPYINDDYIVDIDKNSEKWANAYRSQGQLEDWKETISPCRENSVFRFELAASFAAPLLKLMNHRTFFVHIWGDSRSGKTAVLKAALSVWGEPEELMTSFNATKVGLERIAGFFNDLPLGIDEKQVASKQEFVEQLVYMLSSGFSKLRGTKTGGLQNMKSWRSIILTTGEEPLTNGTSQTGIATRALEINGRPFRREQEARKIHEMSAGIYGTAGPEFLRQLVKADISKLREKYKEMQNKLAAEYPDKLGSHITAVSLIGLADGLASRWIFQEEDKSYEMCCEILEKLENIEDTDVVQKAYEFIQDWAVSNGKQFTDNAGYTRYGFCENDIYYIFPSILEKTLKDAGYSYKKTMRGLAERDLIKTNRDKNNHTFTIVKKVDGKSIRFIKLDLHEAVETEETIPF